MSHIELKKHFCSWKFISNWFFDQTACSLFKAAKLEALKQSPRKAEFWHMIPTKHNFVWRRVKPNIDMGSSYGVIFYLARPAPLLSMCTHQTHQSFFFSCSFPAFWPKFSRQFVCSMGVYASTFFFVRKYQTIEASDDAIFG